MRVSEETKASFSVRERLMYHALEIAGKMLRENPMGDISIYPMGLMSVLMGGESRDPNGEEYISYFLNESTKDLKKKGII